MVCTCNSVRLDKPNHMDHAWPMSPNPGKNPYETMTILKHKTYPSCAY